jgi:hypothetical protein
MHLTTFTKTLCFNRSIGVSLKKEATSIFCAEKSKEFEERRQGIDGMFFDSN